MRQKKQKKRGGEKEKIKVKTACFLRMLELCKLKYFVSGSEVREVYDL